MSAAAPLSTKRLSRWKEGNYTERQLMSGLLGSLCTNSFPASTLSGKRERISKSISRRPSSSLSWSLAGDLGGLHRIWLRTCATRSRYWGIQWSRLLIILGSHVNLMTQFPSMILSTPYSWVTWMTNLGRWWTYPCSSVYSRGIMRKKPNWSGRRKTKTKIRNCRYQGH